MLIHPSQRPRDSLHEELNETLNRHLNPLKHFLSPLVKRLRRLLDVLDSFSEVPNLGEGDGRGDGGNNGL